MVGGGCVEEPCRLYRKLFEVKLCNASLTVTFIRFTVAVACKSLPSIASDYVEVSRCKQVVLRLRVVLESAEDSSSATER